MLRISCCFFLSSRHAVRMCHPGGQLSVCVCVFWGVFCGVLRLNIFALRSRDSLGRLPAAD